ncbi:MAG TPA: VWA domain-containing protein [Vicinamibacterales bacterium]|nr:VWA domain-containing protein [Vicinamibacterales bacterium]
MVPLLLATVLLVSPAAPGASQGGSQQAPVFRSTADVVPLFVTVADKSGRLALDLTREDFQVFDNGKPQPLTQFDHSPQPIRLITLIDISGSMAGNLPILRQACLQLISRLTEGDLARVGTFGQEVLISPAFTRDARELAAWLPTSVPANQPTPLWRAVDQAISLFSESPAGRRVILVLSDSKDGGFQMGQKFFVPNQISERAAREDVMIYGIGVKSRLLPGGYGQSLGDQLTSTYPDPSLGQVAQDTGGGYFELNMHADLAETFAKVADELHSQYLLGFSPPARDGKTHKIEVKVKDNLKTRVRKTYVAPKG